MRKMQSLLIFVSSTVLFFFLTLIVSIMFNAPESGSAADYAHTSSSVYVTAPHESLSVSAEAAVLIDALSGAVLYEKNSSAQLPMASTTKIMTAKIILDCLPLDTVVTVPKEATLVEGSSMYLRENEEITAEHLLYGLLLESGNDAAHTLATALSGSVGEFAALMNKTAEDMGLTHTHFANPHGLSSENHYTSAYELAYITMCAMRNQKFREIVSTTVKQITSIDGKVTRYLSNHNRLLRSYKGAAGVKTGYTIASGRCLVSAAERDGMLLVAVTLNDRNDWKDHTAMLDYGFNNFSTVEIAKSETLSAYKEGVCFTNTEDIYITAEKTEKPMLSYQISLNKTSGKVTYFANSKPFGSFVLTPVKN